MSAELLPNAQRFRVVELEGRLISPGGARPGSRPPSLSISVLDSAYAWREVARFDQADFSSIRGVSGRQSREAARRCAQDAAYQLAADLNLKARIAEAKPPDKEPAP